MKIVEKITHFINCTFRDKIVSIEPPREWWVVDTGQRPRLDGYIVPVTYKYRGDVDICVSVDYSYLLKRVYFGNSDDTSSPVEFDSLVRMARKRALKRATNFYLGHLKKIQNSRKKSR